MQPYDKTSPYQQWVVNNGQLCNAVECSQVLQLKPATIFTSTSVVAVDNIAPANQHHWILYYIPHQQVSLRCSSLGLFIFCVENAEIIGFSHLVFYDYAVSSSGQYCENVSCSVNEVRVF